MIIETKGDVVRLSGSLTKNQWITIKAAANLLLTNHPEGIIVDCANLENVSPDGAKTFLEAIRDIEAAKARIVVVSLPAAVKDVCRMVPGVRSQLPIADSVEEARASLRMANRAVLDRKGAGGADSGKRTGVLLVPLVARIEMAYGAALAARLSRSGRVDIRMVFFLEVPRTLPLNAPLLEEEQEAQRMLNLAMKNVRDLGATATEHVERVRDAAEGILAAAKTYNADSLIFGADSEPSEGEEHERFHHLIDILIHRASCEVLIGRQKPH